METGSKEHQEMAKSNVQGPSMEGHALDHNGEWVPEQLDDVTPDSEQDKSDIDDEGRVKVKVGVKTDADGKPVDDETDEDESDDEQGDGSEDESADKATHTDSSPSSAPHARKATGSARRSR